MMGKRECALLVALTGVTLLAKCYTQGEEEIYLVKTPMTVSECIESVTTTTAIAKAVHFLHNSITYSGD